MTIDGIPQLTVLRRVFIDFLKSKHTPGHPLYTGKKCPLTMHRDLDLTFS